MSGMSDMSDQSDREFDIVLFGATGFVGALTAEHLARHGGAARIALAGRSYQRLEAARRALPDAAHDWPLIEADAQDAEAIRALAARTTVLVSTVGPYLRYGKQVVLACAEAGTHYADLTGEVLFVRWSLDHVATIAERTGAKIVHSCGFDSVPSDLGVLLTAERAASDGSGTLTETTLAVLSAKGGLSGGTIDSARQQAIAARADASARKTIGDSYGLSPRRSEEPRGSAPGRAVGSPAATSAGGEGRSARQGGGVIDDVMSAASRVAKGVGSALSVRHDERTGRWHGPFVMASFNTRIVRLSNTLTDWSYGRGFRYREVTDFGSGPTAPLKAGITALGLGAVVAGMGFAPARAVLDRVLPKPGEGPSKQDQAAGRFRMRIRAATTSGVDYVTTVAAPYDPGYSGTAIMLGQSALALADGGTVLEPGDEAAAKEAGTFPGAEPASVWSTDGGLLPVPDRAGVLTPATGLGDALAVRLRRFDFTLSVERDT